MITLPKKMCYACIAFTLLLFVNTSLAHHYPSPVCTADNPLTERTGWCNVYIFPAGTGGAIQWQSADATFSQPNQAFTPYACKSFPDEKVISINVLVTSGGHTEWEESTVMCYGDPQYSSPILLDLDGNQFHLSSGPVLFDINADGEPEEVAWTTAGEMDAFLFRDLNGNNIVDDGSELFGDSTVLHDGSIAENGYEALLEFDLIEFGGNGDGVIDTDDSIYTELSVWNDGNANGITEFHEVLSLAASGVLEIDVDYRESGRRDQHGNLFQFTGQGKILVGSQVRGLATSDVFFVIYK